ncbi:MAG: hypothetical protein NTW14_01370 [bacterium]|nr:hypothetical protein [bacterium]
MQTIVRIIAILMALALSQNQINASDQPITTGSVNNQYDNSKLTIHFKGLSDDLKTISEADAQNRKWIPYQGINRITEYNFYLKTGKDAEAKSAYKKESLNHGLFATGFFYLIIGNFLFYQQPDNVTRTGGALVSSLGGSLLILSAVIPKKNCTSLENAIKYTQQYNDDLKNRFSITDSTDDATFPILTKSPPQYSIPKATYTNNEQRRKGAFSFCAGIMRATGEGSEYDKMGFTLGLNALTRLSQKSLGGIHLGYNNWSSNGQKIMNEVAPGLDFTQFGSHRIIEIIPVIRTPLVGDLDKSHIFGQLGVGMYIIYSNYELHSPVFAIVSSDASSKKPGFCFGVGGTIFNSEHVRFEILPMYNVIFGDSGTAKYFTIGGGLQF